MNTAIIKGRTSNNEVKNEAKNSLLDSRKSAYDYFSGTGTLVGHTNIASWLGGQFFETITYQEIGYNPSTKKAIYRFRYYLTQHGPSGSYTYQVVPVQLLVNGKVIGTFDIRNKHVTNQSKSGGYFDVQLSPDVWYTIVMRDDPAYNPTMTEVNMSKTVFFSLPSYTVTFKDYDGSTLKSQSVKKYANATAPSNPSRPGYTFTGWDRTFDNVTSNITVKAVYSINSYTNSISHWAWGFRNGEGNNGNANAFSLGTTSFSATFDTNYPMDSSRAIRIPNGFHLDNTFGTSNISGSWQLYNMGTLVTQRSNSMNYEYDYVADTYSVSYDLGGGTNHSQNPSTYNILYGITLKNPTRENYTFKGWYIGNHRVTGINEGKNASFRDASDMYNQLSSRQTGNVTISARWDANPKIDSKSFKVIENDEFPISNLIDGKGYITEGITDFPDKLTAINYPVTATDAEDGNITNKIKVSKVIGPTGEVLSNIDTKKIGVYTIYYAVTDSIGATVEVSRTITVLPKSIPKIRATDRYYYRTTPVTKDDLMKKVIATDKYDGNIVANVRIFDMDKIDSNTTGDYVIVYSVSNRSHMTTTMSVNVHIIDTITDKTKPYNIRYINETYLNTLDKSSKWVMYEELNNELKQSVRKNSREESKYIYEFDAAEIKKVKDDIKKNGFNSMSNKSFTDRYRKNRIK